MLTCSRCGSVLPVESRFCLSCGASTTAAEDETVAMPAAPSRPKSATSPSLTGSHTQTADESRFLPGALLAERYRIVALLGRGGMGEVYRADDLALGQQVALKFLPESVAGNQAALDRFRNEVRMSRQVSHPNVCRVYDVG